MRFTTSRAAVLLLACSIACKGGGDASTAPALDYTGIYTLQSIDAGPLPVRIFDGSATETTSGQWYAQFIVTINRGTLELDEQGHYHTTFEYTLVEDGTTFNRTLEAHGTYRLDGDKVVLLRDNGDLGLGFVRDAGVTLYLTLMGSDPNKAYAFTR